MSVGRAIAERLLRDLTRSGLVLSLHLGNPGATGAGELPGAGRLTIPGAYLSVQGLRVTTAAEPPPLTVGASGVVLYAGLWTSDGLWVAGGRLEVPVSITAGDAVTVRAGTALLAWGEAR